MEVSTHYPYEKLNNLASKYNIDSFGRNIMDEVSNRSERSHKETESVSSSSSICFDEKQEMLYENILDRQTQPQEVTFIQTEESLSDCPTYFVSVNQRRKKYSSHSTNTEIFDQKGELFGHQCRSVKRKLSCENLFHPFLEDLSVTLTSTISKFELPIKKIISQLELNSAEEIKFIEENVRVNRILAQVNVSISDSSICSDVDDDYRMCTSNSDYDGSDDFFYTRITSQYPLMTCPFKRSNESLVAVLDFDVNDEMGSPSGYSNLYH